MCIVGGSATRTARCSERNNDHGGCCKLAVHLIQLWLKPIPGLRMWCNVAVLLLPAFFFAYEKGRS